MARNGSFSFDGGAGSYLGTALLGALVATITLGICYPFSFVLMEQWRQSIRSSRASNWCSPVQVQVSLASGSSGCCSS